MSWQKYIKNIGLILVILGHYYFCSYVLSEVQTIKDYEPTFKYEDKSDKKVVNEEIKNEGAIKIEKVKNVRSDDYLGIIEIPKINLQKRLYDINSYQNDVNKNIEILDSSDMPNVLGGNLILAAHNGNTSVGYFRNLHKLKLGDEVNISYNDVNYTYEITKIYDVLKTGKVNIKRDKSKTTITLITCLGSDRQLVVIGYLK